MKVLKQGLEERIFDRLEKLRSRIAWKHYLHNLNYPFSEKEKNEAFIKKYIKKYEEATPQMISLLKSYRKHVPHIWDQTKNAAVYLLIGKAINDLETLLDLSKNGSSQEIVELSRSAVESLDLVVLFLEDKGETLLKKWFKGKIISNEDARESYHRMINNEKAELPVKEMKSDIYDIYSLYTHSSYAALLDTVDVFNEDFDYKKYSGFHYTRRYLHLIDNVAVNILLGLKNAFLDTKDKENFIKTDGVLRQIGYKNISRDATETIFREYAKKITPLTSL